MRFYPKAVDRMTIFDCTWATAIQDGRSGRNLTFDDR